MDTASRGLEVAFSDKLARDTREILAILDCGRPVTRRAFLFGRRS
jgi:hypothetical protein